MMGNYSLGGGFDPELMRQIVNSVQPSPYGQMISQSPNAAAGVSGMLGRIAGEGTLLPAEDSAFGRASPVGTNTGQDGPSVIDVLTGVLTSPFRLLRGGVQAIEDATGHPNAMRRNQNEAQADVLTQVALRQFGPERLLEAGVISPEQAQAARAPYVAAQSGGGETATGRDTSGMMNPTPTAGWFWNWFTGAQAKEKQRQQDKLTAFYGAMGKDAEIQKLRAQTEKEKALRNRASVEAENARWKLDKSYQYDDLILGGGLEKTAAEIARTRALTGDIGADNARADEAAARAAESHAADLRGKRGTERERKLRMRGMRKDIFGADSGETAGERPLVPYSSSWWSKYNAADAPEKRILMEQTGVEYEEPAWNQRGKVAEFFGTARPPAPIAPTKPSAPPRVAGGSSPQSHPRFSEYYRIAKGAAPQLDEAGLIEMATELMKLEGVL